MGLHTHYFCDPDLHRGDLVPAEFQVRGLTLAPHAPGRNLSDDQRQVSAPDSMRACCSLHLLHACSWLLKEFSWVQVSDGC
jgi:hypothetical protein